MEWRLQNQVLTLRLGGWERLWAFHVGETLSIPVPQIRAIARGVPPFDPWMIRAPGTALPGVLTAGTFYSRRGHEFWYVVGDRPVLVLDVADFYYKRLVLTATDPVFWACALERQRAPT